MRQMEQEGEHPTGLAAIRALLPTGFRRVEDLAMQKNWIDRDGNCIAFPDTKSRAQPRVVGDAALEHLVRQAEVSNSAFVFPADWGNGHFTGIVRVLDRVCARAGLSRLRRTRCGIPTRALPHRRLQRVDRLWPAGARSAWRHTALRPSGYRPNHCR